MAIQGGKVVESGEDQIGVALRAYAKYGYVALYVGLVSDLPTTPLRLPSPKNCRPSAEHRLPAQNDFQQRP